MSGLSKTSLQGGTWGHHSAIRAPRGATAGLQGSGFVGQLNHLLGGWVGGLPSSSACTVILSVFSVNPSVTSAHICGVCAREHTPFSIVPARLPSAPLLSCLWHLTFIYNSIVWFLYLLLFFFFLLCVNVHVSLLSIGLVQCKNVTRWDGTRVGGKGFSVEKRHVEDTHDNKSLTLQYYSPFDSSN